MTRRTTNRPKRAYYAYPWTPKAKAYALQLATPLDLKSGRTAPPISYRTIAAELHNLGLVDQKPTAATVRRLVQRLRAEQAVRS